MILPTYHLFRIFDVHIICLQENEGILVGFQRGRKARAPMTPSLRLKNNHRHNDAPQELLRKTKLSRMKKTTTAREMYRRTRRAMIRPENYDVRDILKRKATK